MRQMFASPRLENVERVAHLLDEAGIENKITDGRTYKGHSRRSFSYADKKAKAATNTPAVWVIKPDDYKRAREIMREAGLLDEAQSSSYLPETLRFEDKAGNDPQRRLMRIKIALLFILGGMAGWMALRMLIRH